MTKVNMAEPEISLLYTMSSFSKSGALISQNTIYPLSDITRGTTKDGILLFSPVNTLKCVKLVELPFKRSSIRPYIQNHNVCKKYNLIEGV